MNILIADKVSDTGRTLLEDAGHYVVFAPEASGPSLLAALETEQPQALLVRSTRVTADMMESCPRLELIVRAGAGYDTIDAEAASGRGIFVSNCPGKNSAAVAELTIGLLLALDRRIPDNVQEAREGRWNKTTYARAAGVRGRTLGVIGLGSIGLMVAKFGQALGMSVIAWSRSLTEATADELGVLRKDDPLLVAGEADAVTLHVAATEETRGLAGRRFFEQMKEGALFINTTRGSVVDEEALRWALDHRSIKAALDVMQGEPATKAGTFEHPLADHPSVYFTHHIGASTQQAQEAIAAEAVRIIMTYDESGYAPNCVNLERHSPATHLLTVRHLDKIGVLAAVLDEVRKAEWNVQEMENLIFAGARAACARIRFDGHPRSDVAGRIEDHPDVLAVSLISLQADA
jgi:D-3-phosphoglycerate dehydrogenase